MPLLIVLLVTVVATCFVILDARARNMNAVGWGCLVLFTTMIARPVYLLVRKPKQTG